MSIGKQLKQAREARALSLEQAAQATHIRVHYLEALEANQFDSLPSKTHLRGFLRAYGEYLKLNSADLLGNLEGDLRLTHIGTLPPIPYGKFSPALTSADAIFRELGQKLRSQRELMGLSLGDIERHTHIRMHYVQALEEGDISHLPSPVQGRGMLSNYASFLGLNTETILLRFADGLQAGLYDRQAARNRSVARPRPEDTNKVPARPSQLHRLFSGDLFAAGFIILFLLGFIIWGAFRISAFYSGRVPSPTAPPVSDILLASPGIGLSPTSIFNLTQVISATPAIITATAPISGTAQLDQTAATDFVEALPTASDAPVQVYVIARQRAWMRVIVDGEIKFEGRVVPGSAYSFAGEDRIELRTGDGGGLQVYFNQQDLGILGTFGEVVVRIFSVEGIQTPTPGILPTSTQAPTGTPTPTSTPNRTSKPGTPTSTPTPFP